MVKLMVKLCLPEISFQPEILPALFSLVKVLCSRSQESQAISMHGQLLIDSFTTELKVDGTTMKKYSQGSSFAVSFMWCM